MKIKAFDCVEDTKTVLLDLKEDDDGSVAVVIVDKHGATLSRLCTFNNNGTLRLCGYVDEEFGFQRGERGEIQIV